MKSGILVVALLGLFGLGGGCVGPLGRDASSFWAPTLSKELGQVFSEFFLEHGSMCIAGRQMCSSTDLTLAEMPGVFVEIDASDPSCDAAPECVLIGLEGLDPCVGMRDSPPSTEVTMQEICDALPQALERCGQRRILTKPLRLVYYFAPDRCANGKILRLQLEARRPADRPNVVEVICLGARAMSPESLPDDICWPDADAS